MMSMSGTQTITKKAQWQVDEHGLKMTKTIGPYKRPLSPRTASIVTKPPPMPEGSTIVDYVREACVGLAGRDAVRTLSRVLTLMDTSGDGRLSRAEFSHGLGKLGLSLTSEDMDEVMRYFDRDGNGFVSLQEFLLALRGNMSAGRLALVHEVYDLLDMNKDSMLSFNEVKASYDVKEDPLVLTGKRTPEQAVIDFIKHWDKNGDNVITRDEFIDFYSDISAGILDDEYFELLLRRCWHLRGSEGLEATSRCRRALVIHMDGTQTVVPVMNDADLTTTDTAKLTERLRRQGVTTAKNVFLL